MAATDLSRQIGRSASLKGATGTALAFGVQNSISQLGAIIGPQIFQDKWATENYRPSFAIMCGCVAGGFVFGSICWYLTWDSEKEARRVHLGRNAALKEGRVVADDAI